MSSLRGVFSPGLAQPYTFSPVVYGRIFLPLIWGRKQNHFVLRFLRSRVLQYFSCSVVCDLCQGIRKGF